MKNKIIWFITACSLIICSIPVFLHLGKPPIYMWDEATYANNAIDMYESHDLIVVRMDGIPDLYNTKPPLVLWFQALSMKIFGLNEFAVRLPSAIFTVCTMVVLLWFSVSVLNSFGIGIIAILTLACSNGIISNHGARSGDLDAALVFWMTLYVFTFLKWLIQRQQTGLHLFIISLGLVGAFLSKGIAGFFFVPFLFLITIFSGQFKEIMKRKEIYFSAIAVIAACGGYYLLRELSAPGYLEVLYRSELSRYGKAVMSWHVEPFGFYLINFYRGRFMPFLFILPIGLLVLFISKDVQTRRILIYLLVITVGYFLFISFPADKLEWYDEPLYPAFSMIIGISITELLKISKKFRVKEFSVLFFSAISLVIAIVYFSSFTSMLRKVNTADNIRYDWDSSQIDVFRIHGAYVKYLHDHMPAVKSFTVYKSSPSHPEHEDQLKFYIRSYEICDSFHIELKHSENELIPSETVMVSEEKQLDSILHDFNVAVLNQWNRCQLLQLNGRKTVLSK